MGKFLEHLYRLPVPFNQTTLEAASVSCGNSKVKFSLYELQDQLKSVIEVYPCNYQNNNYQLCQHDRNGLGDGTTSAPRRQRAKGITCATFGGKILQRRLTINCDMDAAELCRRR